MCSEPTCYLRYVAILNFPVFIFLGFEEPPLLRSGMPIGHSKADHMCLVTGWKGSLTAAHNVEVYLGEYLPINGVSLIRYGLHIGQFDQVESGNHNLALSDNCRT